MATINNRLSYTTEVNFNNHVLPSFTPPAGELLVVAIGAAQTVFTAPLLTSSDGTVFVLATSVVNQGSTLYAFVSDSLTTGAAMTLTFDVTGGAATGGAFDVIGVGGMSLSGTRALKQYASSSGAAGSTPVATFPTAAVTGDVTLGFIYNASNPATITPPTNWTELVDIGHLNPTRGLESIGRVSGFTGTAIIWGSASATPQAATILDIDTRVPPTTILDTLNGTAFGSNTTPILELIATASTGQPVEYYVSLSQDATFTSNVQNFISSSSTPSPGFANTADATDVHPFSSGQKVSYTVQTPLGNGTWFWRASAFDVLPGTNQYGPRSSIRSFTIGNPGTPPTVVANTPNGTDYGSDTTPTIEFTGTDADANLINYEIQISSNASFDGTGTLLTKNSSTDPGFTNTVDTAALPPYTSGQKVSYTVRAASALVSGGTFYWRVRAIDPYGTNTYGAYTAARTFIVLLATEQFGAFMAWFDDPKPFRTSNVAPPAQPPIAVFAYTVVGQAVTFSSASSSDPNGTIVSRNWNMGDGTTHTDTTFTYNYASARTYTVTLIVTDDSGLTSTVTKAVTTVALSQTLYLSDSFVGEPSQSIAPAAGQNNAAPFRFLKNNGVPNQSYGWRNVHRGPNTGDAGLVADGTVRGGVVLPARIENRSAVGASYIGVDFVSIPTRWEMDFSFDPGSTAPRKIGMHFWDSRSGTGETVPGHFSIRFRGWGFDAGNVASSTPLLTPFGGNANNLGNTAGSSGQWPNGDLDPYNGTTATIYTMIIEHVGLNTLKFTFPAQTGQAPITITDDRLGVITTKGVCVCVWENERDLSTESRDFLLEYRAQVGEATAATPARRANEVFASYGINTHFTFLGTNQWNDTAAASSWVAALGTGAIRQALSRNTAGRNAIMTAYTTLGSSVQWLIPILRIEDVTSLAVARTVVNEQLTWLATNFDLSRIRGLPGLNEPNGGTGISADPDWVNKTRWAQQAIYEETRKRPAFNNILIQGPPLNMKGGVNDVPLDAAALGDLSAWLDQGDAHIYPGDDDPENGIAQRLSWVEPVHPGKTVVVSEGGYSTAVATGYTGGSKVVDEAAGALYAPRHLLVHAAADREFYSYETLDVPPPYTGTDRGTGFGLVRVPSLDSTTWTAKPSFYAMKRMLTLFKDLTVHTPQPLLVSVAGPSDLRYTLYHKSNGKWLLAVWRTVDLYNWDSLTGTGTTLTVTDRTVTVTLGTSYPISIYKPNIQDAPTWTNAGTAQFTTSLGGEVHIVQIG